MGKKPDDYILLQNANHKLSDMIKRNKNSYYDHSTSKLNDPKTFAKAYWATLKKNLMVKKIPFQCTTF